MADVTDFAVETTGIDGLVRLTMKQVSDARGTVREFFRTSTFADHGLGPSGPWRQVNVTETRRGAIRGLHGEHMYKLIAVGSGSAFGAYVDVRGSSPTFGRCVTFDLEPGSQVLVPPGVCNGFQARSDGMQYLYCFDDEWRPDMDGVSLTPLDPDLAIAWPEPFDPDDPSSLSDKDRAAPTLADHARSSGIDGS